MKKIEMHVVETQSNTGGRIKTFVRIGTDYRSGMGLPIHAQKIISENTELVSVFEVGDRVTCLLKRGASQNEDGIISGGAWSRKTGIVETVVFGTDGIVRFDDGDVQAMSLIQGDRGYPGRDIQAAE